MQTWVDTHAHLYFEQFDEDRESVIRALNPANIVHVIEVGTDIRTSHAALELARKHSGSAAVGIHPHEAGRLEEQDWEELMQLLVEPDVVALGEIGLDYHYPEPSKSRQEKVFRKQIGMALGLEIPVIIHNRDADEDIVRLVKREGGGRLEGVFHCFSSGWEVAAEMLDLGFYIGIGGILTFHNADRLREVVRRIPLERILLETDSPYLTPHPYRGKRNDPTCIPLIGEALAQLKGIPVEKVARVTTENACRLFHLRRENLFR